MFSPSEFVEIAEALRQGKADGPLERRFRTSISRSYYAVYLTVRQHIRDARSDPSYDVEHAKLAKWLAEHADATVHRFGNEFLDLWKRRTTSDYKLHETVSQNAEAVSLMSARNLIERAGPVVKSVSPSTFPSR